MTSSPNDNVAIADRQRHPNLWFKDGNIILTTDASLFRVHRSVLSMNSPVFADMLSIPQPDIVEDTFEDLPIVDLSDDDKSFTHLLHYFYIPRYYARGSVTPFEKLSSLLRMSTKYQIDDLRNDIISHFSLAYPATLEKYRGAVDQNVEPTVFPPFPGQHFAVVSLARETAASILLPAALWRSMCMSPEEIVGGVVDQRGINHRLASEDMQMCLQKKFTCYQSYVRRENSLPFRLPSAECTLKGYKRKSVCKELAKSKVVFQFSSKGPVPQVTLDYFAQMTAFDFWRPLVCEKCREKADLSLSNFRIERWKNTPGLFKLPPWEEL